MKTLEHFKEKIFAAELKVSEANLKWRLAAEQFEQSKSVKTFNAMDDARIEALGPQIELERAIAELNEAIEEAQKEVSDALDAVIDANEKFEASELDLKDGFEENEESPEFKKWMDAMNEVSLAHATYEKLSEQYNSMMGGLPQ